MSNPAEIINKIENDIRISGYLYFLPDNPNSEYIGGRCHVFWDDSDWMICFETVVYSYGSQSIIAELLCFTSNDNGGYNDSNIEYFVLADSTNNLTELFGEYLTEGLKGDSMSIILKEKSIFIGNKDFVSSYLRTRKKNYYLSEISPTEVMRFLIDRSPEDVYLTEDELKNSLNISMKRQMLIESWYHVDVDIDFGSGENNVRDNEFLNQLAKVIASRSVSSFKSYKNSNTHWENYCATNP